MKTSAPKQTRVSRTFIASLSRALALSTLAAFGLGRTEAANFTWDPALDAGVTGGAGTWDITTANWYNGALDVAWPNGVTDGAIFGGAGGGAVVITTGTGVTANALTFGVSGYTISGATGTDVLTLGGATPTVTVTNAGDIAIIDAVVAGTAGMKKAGAGTLLLSGINAYSGGTVINGGLVSLNGAGTLGAVTNALTVDGATAGLDIGTTNQTAGVVSLKNGGLINSSTGILTGASFAVESGAATAILAGTGGLAKTTAGTVTLLGANTFTGGVSITGGTLSVVADAGLGAAANGVTIDGGTLQATGIFTSARALTLGATGGTVDVTTGNNLTLSSALSADANSLTKSGNGILTLGAASARTGTSLISGGTIVATNVGALGTGDVTVSTDGTLQNAHNAATQNWATNVTLNGGSFVHNPGANQQLNFAAGKALTIGALGGTVEVSPGAGATSKIFLTTAQLAGSGSLTKTGVGTLQLSGANTGFTGSLTVNGGVVELQNTQALGTTANTINVSGGEVVITNMNWTGAINIPNGAPGAIISGNGGNGITDPVANGAAAVLQTSTFSGPITATGNFSVGLRQFQNADQARILNLTGQITGSGNLTTIRPTSGSTTRGTGYLNLTGNNTGYTGQINIQPNTSVRALQTATNDALGASSVLLSGGSLDIVPQVTAAGGSAGFFGRYYNSPLITGGVIGGFDFGSNTPAATRVDATINTGDMTNVANRPAGVGQNNLGIVWTGILNITTGGDYTFSTASDDGSILYLNGMPIAFNDFGQGVTERGGTINVPAGLHTLVVKFGQGGGGVANTAFYNGPDTAAVKVVLGSVANSVTNLGSALYGNTTIDNNISLNAGTTSTINLAGTNTTNSGALNFGAGANLTTSGTTGLETLTQTGAVTLNGTNTVSTGYNGIIANANAGSALTISSNIGESVAGSGFTKTGLNALTLTGNNAFTGTATVTNGRLDLNSTGTAISGNLVINAVGSATANVRLLANEQIANTSAVTVQAGIFDLNGFSETVGALNVSGGIVRNGNLNFTSANLTGGSITANLGGSGGLAINAPGGLISLGGNNTYTGLTDIIAGAVQAASDTALGAAGAGNGTSVSSTGQLQLIGSRTIGNEPLTLNGAYTDGSGALLSATGAQTYGGQITLGSAATIGANLGASVTLSGGVDAAGNALTITGTGNVTLTAPLTNGAGLTKNGNGTLTFAYNLSSLPVTAFNAGVLGFTGPQSFGASTIPAALGYRFNSDPGAGVNITSPAGTKIIAGYAADQALLSRIAAGSAGTFVFAANSSNALNFTGLDMTLAGANTTYSGALTPGTGGFKLGGNEGLLTVSSTIAGNAPMAINGLVKFTAPNTFTGNIAINAGGKLTILGDRNLGPSSNQLTLDGGTLETITTSSGNWNFAFNQIGNSVFSGTRAINIGAGGGTFSVPALADLWNNLDIAGVNELTGTGTLTKTGLGSLWIINSQNFAGNLAIAPNGFRIDVRNQGAFTNLGSITVGNRGFFAISNNGGVTSTRQFTNTAIDNRIADSTVFNLAGGRLNYEGRNTALSGTSSQEIIGTVNLNRGMSEITSSRTGGGGADLVITSLVQNQPGGTVRVNSSGTMGAAGDNGRVIPKSVTYDGVTVNLATTDNVFLGGFAVFNGSDFLVSRTQASAGAAGGLVPVGSATIAGTLGYNAFTNAAAITFGATDIANLTSAANTTLAAGAQSVRALRFGNNAAQTLAFNDAAQQLNITSGGILTDGNNQGRTIGAAVDSGFLTAGATTATTPQQLFLHNNSNQLTINSKIINNPNNAAATVAVVKDLDGTVQLNSGLNTYAGGTFITRGTLTANVAGSLGLGDVNVMNSRLNLNNAGAINAATGTGSFNVIDQGEIFLNNNTVAFTTARDRFVIQGGSAIIGNGNTGANLAINSLTRVAGTPANGGEIQLAPDSIVEIVNWSNDANNGIGTNTIKNLGTNSDLYFGWFNNPGAASSVTIGAGTPWKGLSTNRNANTFNLGSIVANGDFFLQGLQRDGGSAIMTLGGAGDGVAPSIINNAGRPITANVIGQLNLNEDTPMNLPGNLTFALGSTALMQANQQRSLGAGATAATNASILVQSGGTLDPGALPNFTTAVTTLNGNVTVEAAGRFLINDANGIGTQSSTGAVWTIQKDGILELATNQAFYGTSVNRLINAGQFAYQQGAIVRMNTDNVYGMSQFISGETGGAGVIYEAFNSDRTLTDQTNPITTQRAPENIRIAAGGGLANDSADRAFRNGSGMGHITLGDGASLLPTTQTFLFPRTPMDIEAGATINIGAGPNGATVDGHPRQGTVVLDQQSSHTAGAGAKFSVKEGSGLYLNQLSVVPDTMGIELAGAPVPNPVAATPDLNMPGVGTLLLLNRNDGFNYPETIGALTGTGTVTSNQDNAFLQVGWGALSDFTFAGQFSNFRTKQPHINKVGSTRMDITGTNVASATGLGNASTGQLNVLGGTLAISGLSGAVNFNDVQAGKGGTLLIDNSSAVLAQRLGNPLGTAGKNLRLFGGDVILRGNATNAVTEQIGNLKTDNIYNLGGIGRISVDAGAATTTLTFHTIQNYSNIAGTGTAIFRGPGMAGLPGSYNYSSGTAVYTPNAGNPTNGLITAINPNLTQNLALNQQSNFQVNGPGTPLAASRPDILGSTDPNSLWGDRYVTQDIATSGTPTVGFRLLADSEYLTRIHPNYFDSNNGGVNTKLLTGSAHSVYGDTHISTLTLQPGSSLSVGGIRPAAATPSRLLMYAAGALAEAGGTSTISTSNGAYLQNANGTPYYFHTLGDLNVNASVVGSNGLVKTGPGTLTLGSGAGSLSGSFWGGFISINGGRVVMNDNTTLLRGQSNFNAQQLLLNDGELDLNGKTQVFVGLASSNPLPGMGGTLTNSSATKSTLITYDPRVFGGRVRGNIDYVKGWVQEQILTSDNDYSGSTTVLGGTITLRDSGTLSGTSAITLKYSQLRQDNRALSNVINRVPTGIDINMTGGRVELYGAPSVISSSDLATTGVGKAVNMLAGKNDFRVDAGTGGQANLTIGNLTRAGNAVANFETGYGTLGYAGNLAAARGNLGATTYLTDPHIYINKLNGVDTTATSPLTNNILGGWAIVNNSNFASYLPSVGVYGLGDIAVTGVPYQAYDYSNSANWTTDNAGLNPTKNVTENAARTLPNDTTVNALRINGAVTMTMTAGKTLKVNSGGLMTSVNGAVLIGSAAGQGNVTSGTSELYAFINGNNATTMNSVITDNGAPVKLVKSGGSTLILNTVNLYTGGTTVSHGQITAAIAGAIPGDILITSPQNGGNAANVTETVSQGIKATANVTITGGGFVRLNNIAPETLSSVTLINDGGGNPGSGLYGTTTGINNLTLTSPTAITAIDSQVISRPFIDASVGVINFTGAYSGSGNGQLHVVGDSLVPEVGLIYNANVGTVPAGGLFKTGNGLLALNGSGANQFGVAAVGPDTNVFDIKEGIVRVDTANALGNKFAITTVENAAVLLGRGSPTITGSVKLNAGATLGTTEGTTTFGIAAATLATQSTLNIAGNATIQLSDYFLNATQGDSINVNAKLTGSGNLNIIGPKLSSTTATFRLMNDITGTNPGANDYSGTITLGTNAILNTQGNATFTGSQLGTASLVLAGGQIQLRDNGTGSNQNIVYNNPITLTANSVISVDRPNANSNNTFVLPSLTVPAGTRALRVDTGNGYGLAFSSLEGSGSLVKEGGGNLTINSFNTGAGYTGTLTVAGPQGISVGKAQGLIIPTTATGIPANLRINGSYNATASATLAVGATLEVGNNAGSVDNGLNGVTTGSSGGSIALNAGSVLTAPTVLNNGVIGAVGASTAISATTIAGTGVYQSYGQPIALLGTLADNGATPTRLKFAGDSISNFIPAGPGTNTGGAEVQGGTLRVAPTAATANPLGTGGISVLGYPATTLGANSQPVVGNTSTLVFDGAGGAATISQAGNITNSGVVRVSNTTLTVPGLITGRASAYVAGLLEGRYVSTLPAPVPAPPDYNAAGGDLSAARLGNPGNFGIKLEPRMTQENVVTQNAITGWTDNTTFIYTGEFFDADGVFSFAENMDDNTLISIDGVTRLLNNSGTNPWQTVTSTATTAGQRGNTADAAIVNTGTPTMNFGMGAAGDGWHSIEIRIFNGGGGAGPVAANGFAANYGLGLNTSGTLGLDGALYQRPIDPGNGTLFRTPVNAKGSIALDDGTTLNVGGFQLTKDVVLNSAGNNTNLNVTAAGANDAESIQLAGTTATGIVTLATNAAVTTGNLSVVAGGALSLAGDPGSSLTVTTSQLLDGSLTVDSSTLNIQGAGTGTGSVTLNDGVLNLTGSLSGSVSVNGGILTGNSVSPTTGQILGITDLIGGTVKPGSATGTASGLMHFDGGLNFSGGSAAFDLNGTTAGTGYDQLSVIGAVNLGAPVPFTINVGFVPASGTTFVLVANDDVDPIGGGFKLSYNNTALNEGDFFTASGYNFQISYAGGSDNNDITLVVPEPGSAALLLGGLAMLAGRRRRNRA